MEHNQVNTFGLMVVGGIMYVILFSALNPSIANSQQYGNQQNQSQYQQPCNR